MEKNSFSREEVDNIIRQALSRPATSQREFSHQNARQQPSRQQPQHSRQYGVRPQNYQQPQQSRGPQSYQQQPHQQFHPPARGSDESRISAYRSRLSKVPKHDFGQYFAVLKAILAETKHDISCLELIDKSLDDMENDMGKKGFAPLDFKPCRWYNLGNCDNYLPAHLEDPSNPSNEKIRTHICSICYETIQRAHSHPGFQCKLLQFLDENEVPHTDPEQEKNEDLDGASGASGSLGSLASEPKIPKKDEKQV